VSRARWIAFGVALVVVLGLVALSLQPENRTPPLALGEDSVLGVAPWPTRAL
jgi:hypothetical protein